VDINATLIGQMITFALFVWFTMKFVWPLLERVLKEREQKISEGLAAAERGHKELEIAQKYAIHHIHEARSKAVEMIEQARKQSVLIVDQAKVDANKEREQIVSLGMKEIEQEKALAHEQLKAEIIGVAMAGAEKLLGYVINDVDQKTFLQAGIDQIMRQNE
jgi:F-type H+-transporting ATPase subunit b